MDRIIVSPDGRGALVGPHWWEAHGERLVNEAAVATGWQPGDAVDPGVLALHIVRAEAPGLDWDNIGAEGWADLNPGAARVLIHTRSLVAHEIAQAIPPEEEALVVEDAAPPEPEEQPEEQPEPAAEESAGPRPVPDAEVTTEADTVEEAEPPRKPKRKRRGKRGKAKASGSEASTAAAAPEAKAAAGN